MIKKFNVKKLKMQKFKFLTKKVVQTAYYMPAKNFGAFANFLRFNELK
jgi:hypothetical protein